MRSVWLAWLALPGAALAGSPRAPLAAEPLHISEQDVALVVKWRDDVGARATPGGDVEFAEPLDRSALDAGVAAHGAQFEPWIDIPAWKLRSLEERAEARSGRDQPDLAGMHRVVLRDATAERLADLGAFLLTLPMVEFVAPESGPVPPPADIAPTTPDLSGHQGYRGPDPGIDAEYALSDWGLTGAGVRIHDCEYGWDVDHEDLVDGSLTIEADQMWVDEVVERGWHNHGTAVAGELVGQDNGYGVTGLTPAADFGMYPEWTEAGFRRSTAIASAIADCDPGDVVLLEMQTGGPNGAYVPAEYNQAVWTVVRAGVDADVIVVGAAGNGNENLDAPEYEAYRKRGDSGAIIVGAGSPDTAHNRLSFSTYGARVDVQGWGSSVFTTGYGGFATYGDDPHQSYTSGFNGTSSASPIVTGAAALLVEASLLYRSEPIQPEALRTLLVNSGIPAGSGAIGPLPDLRAALAQLDADLGALPPLEDLYTGDLVEGVETQLAVDVSLLRTPPTSIAWHLSDGTLLGTGTSLAWLPEDDGTVEIDVSAAYAWGRTSTQRYTLVVGNVPPALDPLEAPATAPEGTPIVLTATARDVPADPLIYTWRIDGTVHDDDGPTLTWDADDDGTYVVDVTVDDGDGGNAADSIEVAVADVPPEITLNVPERVARLTATELSIDIVDPGDDPYQVRWDLGDGTTADGTTVTHTWEDRGPQVVTAIVTDEDGAEQVFTADLEVVARPLCGCDSGPASGAGWWAVLALLALRRRR